jgi:hypothetical protein
LRRFEDAAHAGGVGRDGLLAKDVLVGVDARAKVLRAEARRGSQNHDIDVGLDEPLEGVQADKLHGLFDRNLDTGLRALLFAERGKTGVNRFLRDIGDGGQNRKIVGIQCLVGCASAAASTTDDADLDRLSGWRRAPEDGGRASNEKSACRRAGSYEIATRSGFDWRHS